jgi:hypothetical protein
MPTPSLNSDAAAAPLHRGIIGPLRGMNETREIASGSIRSRFGTSLPSHPFVTPGLVSPFHS